MAKKQSTKSTTTKAAPFKRPYATHYFHTKEDAMLAAQGAAATEHGAIRAAAVRIFLGQHGMCTVIDRYTGSIMYRLHRGAGGLQIKYHEGVAYKQWEEPKK